MSLRSFVSAPNAFARRATPVGGAFGCRGCVVFLTATLGLTTLAFAQTLTEPVAVPSGLELSFHDMIWDEPGEGLTYRYRFVAPDLASVDFIDVADDMGHLCTTYAVPRIADIGPQPNRIIITLMSQATEFGVANPDVTQFFESYSIENGICIWEVF